MAVGGSRNWLERPEPGRKRSGCCCRVGRLGTKEPELEGSGGEPSRENSGIEVAKRNNFIKILDLFVLNTY